jgi:hypothetical protein
MLEEDVAARGAYERGEGSVTTRTDRVVVLRRGDLVGNLPITKATGSISFADRRP